MSNTAGVLSGILCEYMDSPPRFNGVRVLHNFSFLCCVFCFMCLCSVSCDQYCMCLSGLSILECVLHVSLWIVYSWMCLACVSLDCLFLHVSLWIVYSWMCLACVSLDCLFLNVPSLFFGVVFFYLNNENFFYFSINLKQALCIQIQYVN
jgi:hypothetical protein